MRLRRHAIPTVLASLALTLAPLYAVADDQPAGTALQRAEGLRDIPGEVTIHDENGDGTLLGSVPKNGNEIRVSLNSDRGEQCETSQDDSGAKRQICIFDKPTSYDSSNPVPLPPRSEGTRAATEQRAGQSTDEAATPAVQPFPEYCTYYGTSFFRYMRTGGCGIMSKGVVIKTLDSTGAWRETGSLDFLVYQYVYVSDLIPRWASQIQVSGTRIVDDGAGTTVRGIPVCSGMVCDDVVEASFPTQPITLGGSADGESYYDWSAIPGQADYGTMYWDLIFTNPTTPNIANQRYWTTNIRCDQAVPGSPTAGCVGDDATPAIFLDGSLYPEWAHHVSEAQASGLPGSSWSYTGGIGEPLTRHNNPALQEDNRAAACPDG